MSKELKEKSNISSDNKNKTAKKSSYSKKKKVKKNIIKWLFIEKTFLIMQI